MKYIQLYSDILTVSDTQKYLKLGRVSTYALFKSKGFPCFRIGRSLRICKADLLKWLKDNLSNIS